MNRYSCTSCGYEGNWDARRCPRCGAINRHLVFQLIAILIALSFLLATPASTKAGGGSGITPVRVYVPIVMDGGDTVRLAPPCNSTSC